MASPPPTDPPMPPPPPTPPQPVVAGRPAVQPAQPQIVIVPPVEDGSGLPWGLPGALTLPSRAEPSRSTQERREIGDASESLHCPAQPATLRVPCAACRAAPGLRLFLVHRPESPYPASGPPPPSAGGGWSTAKLPDGREVWVSAPRNAMERLASMLVIERRSAKAGSSAAARFYCLKCQTTFFGSKKRIREHLRGEGRDVKACTMPVTAEEEATLREDEEFEANRLSRHGKHSSDDDGRKDKKRKRPTQDARTPDSESPFPASEPPPAPEGWRKEKDPRYKDERMIWAASPKNDVEAMSCNLVCARTHARTHARKHTQMHANAQTCMHACMHAWAHTVPVYLF